MWATSSGFRWAGCLAALAAALSVAPGAWAGQAQGDDQGQAPQEPVLLEPADELKIPTGRVPLGTVRIPRAVLADGKPLAPGRYTVRLTGEQAGQDAIGQAEQLERWVEFVQDGEVKGRELASVVPSPAVSEVAEARPPRSGAARVEPLKIEDEYVRIWFNRQGDQVLIHLPFSGGS